MDRNQMIQALGEIRDQLVRESVEPVATASSQREVTPTQVLTTMRAVLNDWIRNIRENHRAMCHQHEKAGEECWRTFSPQDIRQMINDAARDLGVGDLSMPKVAEEDKKP